MKPEVTEPKMSNSICAVALKIITANIKDDKEPIVPIHSKYCLYHVSYFSLMGKKETSNCLPVSSERL